MLDTLHDGVVLADAEGRISYMNRAARRLYGTSEEALPPEQWAAAHEPATGEDAAPSAAELPLARAALHGEVVADARCRIRRPDGTTALVESTASPVLDEHGRRLGAALVVREVTESAQLREALRCEASEWLPALDNLATFYGEFGARLPAPIAASLAETRRRFERAA